MQKKPDTPAYQSLLPRPVHLDGIMEIERLCFPCPWKRSFYQQEFEQDQRYQRVVLVEDRVAAFLFAYYIVPEIHISKVAVHPDFQRLGLASVLMEGMERFSLQMNIDRSILEVRVTNEPALTFYERWSYRVVGRRKRYYSDGEDALVMMAPIPRKSR